MLYTPKDAHLAHLRSLLDDRVRLTCGETVPAGTQMIVAGRPTREQLAGSPDLDTMLIPFAGLPAVTKERLADFPHIAVYNLHHNAPMTAEMALMLLLAAARQTVPVDRIFRGHDWSPRYDPYPLKILLGKTILILGYGALGRRVGSICAAMDMRVEYVRRTRRDGDPANVHAVAQLDKVLPMADVLMVCVPGTAETEGLIDAGAIRRLPQGATVVNVGRAAVIDQQALYEGLKDGHLFAAGLDVWYNYPTDEASRANTAPADYPFHELDNVVMSPHHGGGGGEHEVEMWRMEAIAESVNRAAAGQAPPHRVDLEAGY